MFVLKLYFGKPKLKIVLTRVKKYISSGKAFYLEIDNFTGTFDLFYLFSGALPGQNDTRLQSFQQRYRLTEFREP